MSMEAQMHTDRTAPNQTPAIASGSDTGDHAGAVAPRASSRMPGTLGAWWRFTRHLLEMVIAMGAGMAVFVVAIETLGEPPGYANALVEYGLMGAFMSVPMIGWMRFRGHPWSDGLEMTAAMLIPTFALVLAMEWGVANDASAQSDHGLMMLTHTVMIAGMVALMLFRWDRYAHGVGCHRPAPR